MSGPPFRDIVETYILPMFPGTNIDADEFSENHRKRVANAPGACQVYVSNNPRRGQRLTLGRSQPFEMSDLAIIDNFLTLLANIPRETPRNLVSDLLQHSQRRAIANSVDANIADLLVSIFDQYSSWAEQTYEGNRIACGVGIEAGTPPGSTAAALLEVFTHDFAKVVSNGVETLLVCSQQGNVIEHVVLPSESESENVFAPYRFGRVAKWTEGDRSAVVLNRNGDILVFRNGELRFAKRRGVWRHFTHQPIIQRMLKGGAGTAALRQSLYRTALDVSFARTGACLAIVKDDQLNHVRTTVVQKAESVWGGTSIKAECLRTIASGAFQDIPRLRRQELAGIDGAVVLDRNGNIIDIGSIVQIEGGSTGGGRLAATKQLSKHGLAIKVSADGAIQGFANEEKLFEVG